MPATRFRKRSGKGRPEFVQKPRGVLHPRVQAVGPEHFGIVTVDCAKARSKWMLCDFYGKVLIPPAFVAHNRVELDAMTSRIRAALAQHALADVLVAVERTGHYHHAVKNACTAAGFDVRVVHPFTTKQFRQPADPGNKTDDTDLAALHRATVNGFALAEKTLPESWRHLQLLVRHRRSLVHKMTALCCQIREHLHAALPGYAACFENLWASNVAWPIVRHFDSAPAIAAVGLDGLARCLHQQQIRFQRQTSQAVLDWAKTAAPADAAAAVHRRIALAYEDDRRRKTQEIIALERDIAQLLVRTPYVLLLSFPGINVVSAADFAAEMGPIEHYANPHTITGRAGLFPARYQSDRVDRADGPLVRRGNRALRAAILGIAANLVCCNQHFRAVAAQWRALGKDPRWTRVKVGFRFCRIAYHMVAGRQVFHHPSLRERGFILDKLLAFHTDHQTPMPQMLQDMNQAMEHVPKKEHRAEAQPLADKLQDLRQRRRTGPQLLADTIAIVLARLGVGVVQSEKSEESDLT